MPKHLYAGGVLRENAGTRSMRDYPRTYRTAPREGVYVHGDVGVNVDIDVHLYADNDVDVDIRISKYGFLLINLLDL